MKSLSILIPNYNGAELLKENLPYAFRALDKLDSRFEILVADDCSKDDSCQILELHFEKKFSTKSRNFAEEEVS